MSRTHVLTTVIVAAAAATLAAQSTRSGRTANGIAYDVQGQGPPVVLVSGSNLDRRMWAREAAWLAPAHTVIRYDLRAHGASDTATVPFNHADDLLALLDELRLDKATLIGLSAGSVAALDAALMAPARVARLVLVGPGISGFRPATAPPFTQELIAALQAGDYRKANEVLLASSVFAAPPESQALVRQMVTENDRLWTVPASLLRPITPPAVGRLGELKIPTLILLGEEDVLQREAAELLATEVSGARLVVIPGGGHLLNLTSPEAFRAEVSQFLR